MPRRSSTSAATAVARHALRQERVRLGVICTLVAAVTVAQLVGYRSTYPTQAQRALFAAAFKDNLALRIFYGIPRDLATVGGYVEFRVVGIASIIVAGWAVFAAVRALRGEEDDGRFELILAGALGRRAATGAVLAALAVDCFAVWLAAAAAFLLAGTAVGDLTVAQALLLAASIAAPGLLFAAIGALACQLAPTRRGAQALSGAIVAAALLLRIVSDLSGSSNRLRWLTPLGWAEEVHAVTGSTPALVGLCMLAAAVVAVWALEIAARRDVGTGVLSGRGEPRSSMRLLGSPARAALRGEAPTLIVWVAASGVFAAILGAFAKSIAEEARKSGLSALGTYAITTATSYLAFAFVLFTLVVALFAAGHIGTIRGEESSGRLETLLALPVSRRGWILGRLAIAVATTTALALLIGLIAWAGAASQRSGVGLGALLAAGANGIPAALLFLGIGTLLFAVAPRQSGGATLALVGAAFLWELVGALVGAPVWLLDASPFHHVAAVPQAAFDLPGALGMLALGAVAAGAGVVVFLRRDLRTD